MSQQAIRIAPAERKQRLAAYIISHGQMAYVDPSSGYLIARSINSDHTVSKKTWTNCPTFRQVRDWLGY